MPKAIVSPSRAWSRRDTLAVLLLLAALFATAQLGRWQHGRALAKQALLDAIAGAAAAPVLPALPPQLGADAWRAAVAQGVYQADWTVVLRNRSHGDASGDIVLTPLLLAGSQRYLMVERGWIAADASGTLPALPTPAGAVVVNGRLAPAPSSWLALGHEDDAARVRQNIDLARFAAYHHIDLLPYVLQQTRSAGDGLSTDWPQPDLGIATNRGYAFQWWAMSTLSAVLLVLFLFKRWRSLARNPT